MSFIMSVLHGALSAVIFCLVTAYTATRFQSGIIGLFCGLLVSIIYGAYFVYLLNKKDRDGRRMIDTNNN